MEPACNGCGMLCWYLYALNHRRGDQVKGHYFKSGSCDLVYLEVVKRQCKVKDFCKLLCNCLGKRGRRVGGGEDRSEGRVGGGGVEKGREGGGWEGEGGREGRGEEGGGWERGKGGGRRRRVGEREGGGRRRRVGEREGGREEKEEGGREGWGKKASDMYT